MTLFQWGKRAKYNRTYCVEYPFTGTQIDSIMDAVRHSGGMLNSLILTDTLFSFMHMRT